MIRSDLSATRQAMAVSRRKEIYEIMHPETKAGAAQAAGMNKALGNNVAGKSAATFTAATAKATGKAERTIRLAAARGKALGDSLDDIEGTSLDNKSEIDALARMTKEERKPLIDRAKAGERVSAALGSKLT